MENTLQKIETEFFIRPVDAVARDLVGKILVREKDGKEIARMRIMTTEAYGGGENSSMPDPASHSHENHRGPNQGEGQELEGGNLYIAYSRSNQGGNKRQINITTGDKGDAQAVLIKECQLLYKDNIPNKEDNKKGKLTETKIADKLELSDIKVGGYCMVEHGISVFSDGELIKSTVRENVKSNKLWRFSITRLFCFVLSLMLIMSLSGCGTSKDDTLDKMLEKSCLSLKDDMESDTWDRDTSNAEWKVEDFMSPGESVSVTSDEKTGQVKYGVIYSFSSNEVAFTALTFPPMLLFEGISKNIDFGNETADDVFNRFIYHMLVQMGYDDEDDPENPTPEAKEIHEAYKECMNAAGGFSKSFKLIDNKTTHKEVNLVISNRNDTYKSLSGHTKVRIQFMFWEKTNEG